MYYSQSSNNQHKILQLVARKRINMLYNILKKFHIFFRPINFATAKRKCGHHLRRLLIILIFFFAKHITRFKINPVTEQNLG